MTLWESLRAKGLQSLHNDVAPLVGIGVSTLTSSAILGLHWPIVEAAALGQAAGTAATNFIQSVLPPAGSASSWPTPEAGAYPVIVCAPTASAEHMTPGYFAFAFSVGSDQHVHPKDLGAIFPFFFSHAALARDFAATQHPFVIETLSSAHDTAVQQAAAILWQDQFVPTLSWMIPQSPWILAQFYPDPALYGAWQQVLTPHGSAYAVLSRTDAADARHPLAFTRSLTDPPYLQSDPHLIRQAIRQITGPAAAIPDLYYYPRELFNQMHWEPGPTHAADHLIVHRTVPMPLRIQSSPEFTQGSRRPLPGLMPDKHPSWYVQSTDHWGTVLWHPGTTPQTFVLGGSGSEGQWQPYRFASLSEGLAFLGQCGMWGQVHPTERLLLQPRLSSLSSLSSHGSSPHR